MAPEIALEESANLTLGSLVLDPMAGSGMVVRTASEQGHKAYGCDTDPLAVLMARVWTTPIDVDHLRAAGAEIVKRAKDVNSDSIVLPWIDTETQAFIDYWFGVTQQAALRRLSNVLQHADGATADALRVALSRVIITKDYGASLARDVSHSRPHRVRDTNDFDVMKEFDRSVRRLAQRLENQPPPGNATMIAGDARRIDGLTSMSVDAVITSPPYLNAIDYMRAHRLTLVWLGHRVADLRIIRAAGIGTERMADREADYALARELRAGMEPLGQLPRQYQRMIDRYVLDLFAMITEMYRLVRSGGKAVFVVGNSCLKGVFIRNACAAQAAAERAGFRLVTWRERELPSAHRYLPPPTDANISDLEKRMRTETVLTFRRP